MRDTVDFFHIQEARLKSGFLFEELLTELCIQRRTWYRWKKQGYGPLWALRMLELLSGDLERLGWPKWHIQRGTLLCRDLCPSRYNWTPGQLMADAIYSGWREKPSMGVNPSTAEIFEWPVRTEALIKFAG